MTYIHRDQLDTLLATERRLPKHDTEAFWNDIRRLLRGRRRIQQADINLALDQAARLRADRARRAA
ncbi:MAG: hypothetical protein NTV56_19975 [Alphaproteobacteria bacterium]|nr:hypothetical protein [Alphaproteobacteria bacterium]